MDKTFHGGDFKLVATQAMSRSVLLAGILCLPVFYALMKGDPNSAYVEKEKKY